MIGGEFEIDLSRKREFVPQADTYYYASGRAALYQILSSLGGSCNTLWMPDWLCHTMVDAVEKARKEVRYYELDSDLKATTEALDRSGFGDGDTMLMVNYFGLQDLALTAKVIKDTFPNAIVIEDDVQAYWAFAEAENAYVDYRFTSLRKAFAIPDGGLVKTKRKMPVVTQANTFAPLKIKAGVMKYHRGEDGVRDEDYLALFKQGDALIGENYHSCMSGNSKRLFSGMNFKVAKQKRQSNAKCLLKSLAKKGIEPIIKVSEESVPLFVPIYLENRDAVRRRLFQHEVYCPVHWPLEGCPLKRGTEMAAHELSLIVDQRYSESDMDQIVSFI